MNHFPLTICLFLLSLSPSCLAVCTGTLGCYPPLTNIPTKPNAATISASSTCGQTETTQSCPFFNLLIGDLSQCYNCSAGEFAPSLAIDGSLDTWWQAPNDESTVTLRLDFSGAFLISEMSLGWQNPRPRAMVLDFSTDNGTTWTTYQTFSSDCQLDFPVVSTPDPAQLQIEPMCDQTQTDLNPYSGGNINFSPASRIAGGVFNASALALSYLLVTNLRARVLGFNQLTLDTGYFHAVSEWGVQGSCFCNGHGDECDATLPHVCRCGHNTEGDNCERCQPLFNNRPYLPGSLAEASECQACQCNSHSSACEYNSTEGAGVCQACQHNTTGDNCETCLPFFYLHPLLLPTDPGICPPCACSQEGTSDAGECQVSSGNCSCKRNVMGRQCDQCRLGSFLLSSLDPDGCQDCGCNVSGSTSTTCHSDSGQCVCKGNVEGRQCDTCKDGFYRLSAGNPQGCVPCACDAGGASSPVCGKETGECECLRNVTGSKCDSVESGFFIPSPEHLTFEGESGNIAEVEVPGYGGLSPELRYTGSGLARVERGERLELVLRVPRLHQYVPVLRYFTPQAGRVMVEISLINNIETCDTTNRVQSAVLNSSASFHALRPTCLQDSSTLYQLALIPTNATIWLDSVLLVPDLSPSPLYSQQVEECVESYYSLYTARNSCAGLLFSISAEFYRAASPCLCDQTGASSSLCGTFGGQCPCRSGVTGRDCSTCAPGYHSFTSSGCTACGCDSTGARDLPCATSTGQCVCRTGVAGVRCDMCATGSYNLTSSGCESCACSGFSSRPDCDSAGACTCLPGVTEAKCSECSAGYFNLSAAGCQVCGCSQSASSSLQCSEEGNCSCVNGFSGDKCRICSPGSYVTAEESVPVCKECNCFTQANSCSNLSTGYRVSQHITNFTTCDIVLLDIQIPDCTMGWRIESGFFLPLLDNEYVTFLISSPTQVYFRAPHVPFLGDRSLSYGLNIVFSVFSIDLLDEPEFVGDHPDVILTGEFMPDQLVSSFPGNVSTGPGSPFSIPLVEGSWRVGDRRGPLATYEQLIRVLANLTSIQIRARYSEASLARVSLEHFLLQTLEADSTASGVMVENCDCPAAYQPPFCRTCSQGYFRPSNDPTQVCMPCQCNGHTDRCDPITGLCLDCLHNATGGQCETCSDGFYGDATLGTATDCQVCPCPLPTQSFSPTCSLAGDGLPTCDNCSPGYTGRTCEVCQDGYFGDPTSPGAKCANCSCSDNIDLNQTGNCNTSTGECIRCLNNTAGFECEVCAPGYFGDALADTCSACRCDSLGREDNICERSSGVCTCKGRVLGDRCDVCEAGYWGLHLDLPEGCISCDCCSNGSTGVACDTNSGVCECRQNVGGETDIKCCQCSYNAFNFTERGCDLCGCVPGGALTQSCDLRTGVCQCEVGVEGDKCDECAFNYTGSVPRCERCPQCFDDWLIRVQAEQTRVERLNSRVDSLLASYQPLTAQNISLQIAELNSQLSMVSSMVQSSQLNSTQLSRLDAELSTLAENLTVLASLISDIETSLNASAENIRFSMQFDGSVVLASGEVINASVLISQLREVMNNITQAQNTAAATRRVIAARYTEIFVAQASIDTSQMRVALDSERIENITTQLSSVSSTIASFMGEYNSNRMQLGLENHATADNAAAVQNVSRLFLSQAHSQAMATANRTAVTKARAEEKELKANASLASVQALQEKTDNATTTATAVHNASVAVFNATQAVDEIAEQVLQLQAGNLTLLRELQMSAVETESILTESLAVTGREPSRAEVLSEEINRLYVPETVVESIRADANTSLMQARAAEEVALQAKRAASNASRLLGDIVNTLNFTQLTQTMTTNVSIENAKNALASAAIAIGAFYEGSEELVETSERIFQLGREVRGIRNGIDGKFFESAGNATAAVGECFSACEVATQFASIVNQSVNFTESISDFVSNKETIVSTELDMVQSIVTSTSSLMQNVTSVQLSELSELMLELEREEEEIDALLREAEQLQLEITRTERSISGLADLYQSCPN